MLDTPSSQNLTVITSYSFNKISFWGLTHVMTCKRHLSCVGQVFYRMDDARCCCSANSIKALKVRGLMLSSCDCDPRDVELLDKLDGIRLNKRKELEPQRMEDYLQLPDDYESRTSQPGKKRVCVWTKQPVFVSLLDLLYATVHFCRDFGKLCWIMQKIPYSVL